MSRLNRPTGMQKAFKAGMPLFVLLLGSVYGIQIFLQTQIEMKGNLKIILLLYLKERIIIIHI